MKRNWMKLMSLLIGVVLIAGAAASIGVMRQTPTREVEEASNQQSNQGRLKVAVVNEDVGTEYNGQPIALGQLFTESLVKGQQHEATYVSRSLAERGLEAGQYNLLVLLPSDFSQKAMGLEQENPARATISYKLNTEDALEVQRLSREAANGIVQDMNQRLIDIYFSSILGNLQNAQVNVLDVVNREGEALGYYNQSLMTPMNRFSGRFTGLSQTADQSESQLGLLAASMEATNVRFTNIVGKERNYDEELAAIIAGQTVYARNIMDQHESMMGFEDQMGQLSVEQQFTALGSSGEVIASQFLDNPIYANVISNTAAINQYLDALSANLAERNAGIVDYMEEEFAPNVYQILAERLQGEGNQRITLESINEPAHQAIRNDLFAKIVALPTLDQEEVNASELTQKQKNTFNSAIGFANQYLAHLNRVAEQNGTEPPVLPAKPGLGLNRPLEQVNQELRTQGRTITVESNVDLEDSAQFQVELPQKFRITNAVVHYQNGPTSHAESLQVDPAKPYTAQSGEIQMDDAVDGQDVRLELSFKLDPAATVGTNERMVTEFIINKRAETEVRNEKKSIMDRIKELFGFEATKETITQVFLPTVSAAELPEAPVEAEEAEAEPTPEVSDLDGDGIPDTEDADVDGDGYNNAEEIAAGSNPEDAGSIPASKLEEARPADLDGDGVPDTEDDDIDGDGYSNEEEVQQGSDPRSAGSIPAAQLEEPMGEPFVITRKDAITVRTSTQLVPDKKTLEQSVLAETVEPYHELVALVSLYYGYDLANGEAVPESLAARPGSLAALLSTDDLAETITESLVDNLVRDVSSITQTTDAVLTDIQALKVDAASLATQVGAVNALNQQLNATVLETIGEVGAVHQTLTERTPFEPVPLENPEGMVTVATAIHQDLNTLLQASAALLSQTEENKGTAQRVFGVFDDLNGRVAEIEEEGTVLRSSSETFITTLMNTYDENLTFAENFSQVMANSQIGNRKNEQLFQYLSNPIGTSGSQTVAEPGETAADMEVKAAQQVDNRSAFIITILAYLISLLTAYALHQYGGDIRFGKDAFTRESPVKRNMPVTVVATGTALVEGLVIGLVSASRLNLSSGRTFGLVFLLMSVFLLLVSLNTWLLRQLAALGMFLSLGLFTLYLISANQLLLGTYSGTVATLGQLNPLGTLETMLFRFLNSTGNWVVTLGTVILLGIVFTVLNLFVSGPKRPTVAEG